jgi:isoquinoline 1-oxidoreductase alpha subunit
LWILRDHLNLTGTKYGCGIGACGACTVVVDGEPARSCSVPLGDLDGAEIVTIEGVTGDLAETVKLAWLQTSAVQCGYCQSGQIVSAIALLSRTPQPTDQEIEDAMDPILCRCGTYPRIKAAIKLASNQT